ncbi:hypothetical protein CDEF62S_04792 [Castellaniella defragrans]
MNGSCGPSPSLTDLVARVEQALAGRWFAVTAQSGGFAVLRLRGPGVRDVLNGGCPLDLHPRTLPPGTCAQSHFFKASVLLRPLGDTGNAWELIVRRSFADYVVRMLLDAMEGAAARVVRGRVKMRVVVGYPMGGEPDGLR